MKKIVKPLASLVVITIYLLLLRYVAPSTDPYFILGTAVVGLAAWLCGSVMGLATALLLIPLTSIIYNQFAVSTSYASFSASPAYISMQILAALTMGHLGKDKRAVERKESDLEIANERLRNMLLDVQELGGLHNMCSECKSIQDKDGTSWMDIGTYLKEQTKMEFSHCICPSCAEKFQQHEAKTESA